MTISIGAFALLSICLSLEMEHPINFEVCKNYWYELKQH
jgi:hypothetical protein